MNVPTGNVVEVIAFLLPGFVAAWIFYGLTAHEKRSPFERTVEALIFTCVVQSIAASVQLGIKAEWTTDERSVASLLAAVVVGLAFATLANHDCPHRLLRWLCVTKRTSYPSEWFSALNRERRWVTLHLSGEQRLFGWAEEWPDHPDGGHFSLMYPEWLLDDGRRIELLVVERMLVPASSVEMVEFSRSLTEIQELESSGVIETVTQEPPKPVEDQDG